MIQKVIVAGFLIPKSTFSLIINWFMGGRGALLGTISNFLININTWSMIKKGRVASLLRPEYTSSLVMTWVMRGKVSGLRSISTITITINSCYTISRGRVQGLLRPIPTSSLFTTLITTTIKSIIVREILDGLLTHISNFYITKRHFNTYIIRNNIVIKMVGGKMAGISRLIYKTHITT